MSALIGPWHGLSVLASVAEASAVRDTFWQLAADGAVRPSVPVLQRRGP